MADRMEKAIVSETFGEKSSVCYKQERAKCCCSALTAPYFLEINAERGAHLNSSR